MSHNKEVYNCPVLIINSGEYSTAVVKLYLTVFNSISTNKPYFSHYNFPNIIFHQYVGELMFCLVSLHVESFGSLDRLQNRKKALIQKITYHLSISVHVNLHIQLYKITISHIDNTCCVSLYIVSMDIVFVFLSLILSASNLE